MILELRASAMARLSAWCQVALLGLAACQTKAAPATDKPAQASPQPSAVAPPTGTKPQAATAPSRSASDQQLNSAPPTPEADFELVDLLLKRDFFTLSKQAATARFSKFVPLKETNPMLMLGVAPHAELEVAFIESGTAGNWLAVTAELNLFAKSESEAVALHGTLAKHLRTKLGKVRKRLHEDLAVPSLLWMNGNESMVVLSADPSEKRPGEWQVCIQIDAPQMP